MSNLFDCQQSKIADEILEARSPNPLGNPVIDAQKIVVRVVEQFILLEGSLNSIIINKRNN